MITIRQMEQKDTEAVFQMMRIFYDSPAVLHQSSDAVLRQDIAACVGSSPFVEGFVFEDGSVIAGYSMAAKGYSTEYGGVCIWVEDIYVIPEYRGRGIGTQLFQFLEGRYRDKAVRIRLEVEKNNQRAVECYKKIGFEEVPYTEMSKEL